MLLLADENQHPLVIARLRAAGYNVEALAETSSGMTDVDILRRADIASTILVTYDRDFGELIFKHGHAAPLAVLYTRLSRAEPDYIADRLIALLAGGIAHGHITSVTKDGERVKPFPSGATNA